MPAAALLLGPAAGVGSRPGRAGPGGRRGGEGGEGREGKGRRGRAGPGGPGRAESGDRRRADGSVPAAAGP